MKVLAYIFGILALMIWVSSVQAKEKKNILLMQAFANLFYALQYFIFGYLSTGLMNMVSVIRSIIFAKNAKDNKQPSVFYLILFILIIIILGLIYCRSFIALLPIIGTILYTISGWVKSNTILRYIYMICAVIFFVFNLNAGTYIPLIGNICEIISGTISLIRFKPNKSI